MRRPVLYLAGLLMATGASLTLAGPASAVVSHDRPTSAVSHDDWDWSNDNEWDIDDSYNNNGDNRNNCYANNSGSAQGLLALPLNVSLLDFRC